MEEKPSSLDLKDIPDVSKLLPSTPLPWWVWIAAAIVLATVLWLIFRRRSVRKSQPQLRLRAYQEALASLEKMAGISSPVPLATGLSLTLRHYLAAAFSDPSLFETHEEFISRHNTLGSLPATLRDDIGQYFAHLARYKYAPSETAVDLSTWVPQARDLLKSLHANPPVTPPALP